MCGIFGFTKTVYENGQAESLLERMSSLLRYRGPDGNGTFIDSDVALGHNRLSIIDLSTGAQPMHDLKRRYVITYNGEVYNFRELRAEFEKLGFEFQTKSDTEAILAAYHFHRERCVNHLQGMFAFAIWDRTPGNYF